MPDDSSTLENPPLDAEDWQTAFEPYAKDPTSVLMLAQRFAVLQEYVQSDAIKATAAINRAVDCLYEHSEFRSVSLELFRAAVEGRITTEQEDTLRQLGIRI
jgi:hypothetical protein